MGKQRQFPLMNKDSIDFKSHLAAVTEEVEVILNDVLPLPSGNQKAVVNKNGF